MILLAEVEHDRLLTAEANLATIQKDVAYLLQAANRNAAEAWEAAVKERDGRKDLEGKLNSVYVVLDVERAQVTKLAKEKADAEAACAALREVLRSLVDSEHNLPSGMWDKINAALAPAATLAAGGAK